MNQLEKYFTNNKGRLIDKWSHCFDIYDKHLSRFKGKPVVILEIGVFDGGSLQMWRDYFGESAQIYGIDINPECKIMETEGFKVFTGSQEDKNFLEYIKGQMPKADIIIDDGGHTMSQQITSFESLFSHLKDDGVYLCEDLHTSYWEEYGGGIKREGTFIEYSKGLIDTLNYNHLRDKVQKTHDIKSITFYDSVFVAEKGSIKSKRVLSGEGKITYYNDNDHNSILDKIVSKNNKFCVLLTATILPNKDVQIQVKRNNPQIREQDYLRSLTLWLSRTNLPIVFCENSGYDLINIRNLCDIYPGRVEIIQFNLTDYSEGGDYGYGEFKTIEKIMNDSYIVKSSENIIKVTGRVFIENIDNILSNFEDTTFVNYTAQRRKDCIEMHVQTIIFIFKKDFFSYMYESRELLKFRNMEYLFGKKIKDARKDGHIIKKMAEDPIYNGFSGHSNVDYESLIVKSKKDFIVPFLKFQYKRIASGSLSAVGIWTVGIFGIFLKSNFPRVYKILKPYFPDKKINR